MSYWREFERWLADRWCDRDGRTSPISGATKWCKEDVRGEKGRKRVLVQAKESANRASVSRKDVEQLVERATQEGRTPVVALAVGDLAIVGEVIAWR